MVIKARIQKGRLVAEAPPGYEEGDEVEIEIIENDFEARLTAEERADLGRSLEEGLRDTDEGRITPAAQVLEELASRRR